MDEQNKHNDAGFTLIETIIALMIFTVGILSVGLMQLSALQGNSVANQVTEAMVFGSDQIEQMLSWDYDDDNFKSSNNNAYTLPNGDNYTADGHQTDSDNYYHAYWQITDDSPVTNSKTIVVTVFWNQKGLQRSFSLSTVKAR